MHFSAGCFFEVFFSYYGFFVVFHFISPNFMNFVFFFLHFHS